MHQLFSVRAAVETLEPRQLMAADVGVDRGRLIFSDVQGGAASAAQTVVLRNAGTSDLAVAAGGISLVGPDAAKFKITSAPAGAFTIAPGGSRAISVAFNPTTIGPQGAALRVRSNDPDTPALDVTLRGLGTKGLFGGNEPSLQWIFDTYQIPVTVGDADPSTGPMDFPPKTPNDEIVAQLFTKAGPGPVTVEPIAVYSNESDPALGFGYYNYATTTSIARTELFTVPAGDMQTLNPRVVGNNRFDPGSQPFGLYSVWPAFDDRTAYSEDFRNTWEPNAARRREMRFYPLKNADGSTVPSAYVMGNEEAANHDLQDGVFIVRNVKPTTGVPSAPTSLTAAASGARVSLAWKDNSNFESGFRVERSTGGGAFTQVAALGPDVKAYADSSVSPATAYRYRVRAFANSGTSAYSNTRSVTTPAGGGGATVYQAEAATLSGPTVSRGSAGYTGAGYADFANKSGDFIEWTLNVPAAGAYSLDFRYANGGSADRPLELKVNNSVLRGRLSFAPTGAWTTWRTVSLSVSLTAGVNKVRLTAVGSSGGNFDSLTVR